MLTGAWRVDLEGKPAGCVSADDEKHAKAKQAGIRIRREAVMAAAIPQAAASRAHEPALAAKAEPGPKRLSLADLREAARRRREWGALKDCEQCRYGPGSEAAHKCCAAPPGHRRQSIHFWALRTKAASSPLKRTASSKNGEWPMP